MYDRGWEPMLDQRRFTWGGVYPVGCPEGPSRRVAECLIEGEDPSVAVTVSFLQLVEHGVLDARGEPVEELTAGGVVHREWAETVERQVRIAELPGRTASIAIGADESDELREGGWPVGRLTRHSETLHGTVEARRRLVAPELWRIRVSVANRLEWDGGSFEETLMHTLCSSQVTLRCPDGAFADGSVFAALSSS